MLSVVTFKFISVRPERIVFKWLKNVGHKNVHVHIYKFLGEKKEEPKNVKDIFQDIFKN